MHDPATATATASVAARSSGDLRRLWGSGKPALGLWSSLADPVVAELLGNGPFDYVCVDLQHGAATFSELPAMLQAMRAAGGAPVVRVPWNEPVSIMRALDTGASAVVVPMVSSVEEARRAASACRFPPEGTRSWGPMWAHVRPDGVQSPAEQDAAVICLVMIETAGGVEAVADIVAVPGVDGVYIGPSDLALSCGYGRGTYRDTPEVDALLQSVLDRCREAGVIAGLHCSDAAMARDWAERGATMLTVAQDTGLLNAAMQREWAALEAVADRGRRRDEG